MSRRRRRKKIEGGGGGIRKAPIPKKTYKMLSITKTTVSYTCCLCDEKRSTPIDCVIPDYGNNPFPLKSVKEVKKGVRCCDKCNWEKVMTARFGFPIVFTGK